jgi:protocatechuate 3,4-dioxygenase beta subunit
MLLVQDEGEAEVGGGATTLSSAPDVARKTDLPSGPAADEKLGAPAATAPSALQAKVVAPETNSPQLSAAEEVAQTTLTGRVVDPSGRPVSSARIVYHGSGDRMILRRFGSTDATSMEDPETMTDRDGRFSLTVALPDSEQGEEDDLIFLGGRGARLVATHDAFTVLVQDCPTLEQGREVDMGTLSMDMGSQVAGRVLDEAGRPVGGAEVTVRSVESDPMGRRGIMGLLGGQLAELYTAAVTDADGRFFVTGVQPGQLSVSGQADGYQVAQLDSIESEPGLTLSVGDLVLSAGASIAGWVVDGKGEPIEGANVRVSSVARLVIRRMEDVPRQQLGQEMRLRAATDADGHFELHGLGLGQYTLHVSSDGYAGRQKENVVAGTLDVSLSLDKLGGLLVSVRSSLDDGMVDGAKLKANAAPAGGGFSMRFGGGGGLDILEGEQAVAAAGVDTDPAGMYFVQGAGSTGTMLEIVADGFAAASVTAPSVSPDSIVEFDVLLMPESVIAGIVLDATGQAVPHASVRLAEYVAPPTMQGGRFEMRREIRREIGGGGGGGDEWKRTSSDENGAFSLRGIPEGDWELTASADGFASDDPAVVSLAVGDSVRDVEIIMLVAGSVVGIVIGQDGSPVQGASLTVTPFDPGSASSSNPMAARMAALMGGGAETRRTSSDAEGHFAVKDLLPGLYDVKLAKQHGMRMGGAMMIILDSAGNDSDVGERVEVLPREEAWVELVRPPTASLSGRVLAGGRPMPGVSVELNEANSFMPFGGRSAETDGTGRYVFEDVEPGEYDVSAIVSGAALPEERSVDLLGGIESQADLIFSGSTVSGRVVDRESGVGVPGVTINLSSNAKASSNFESVGNISLAFVTSDGGGAGSGMTIDMGGGDLSKVRTGQDGVFRIQWVKPGSYGIETQGGGYTTAKAGPFDVKEGRELDDIEIEADRGAVLTGSVVSLETGKLIDSAPMRLESLDGSDVRVGMVQAGRYEFDGLSAGQYTVSVMGSGFGSAPMAMESVTLTTGEMRILDLTTSAQGMSAGPGMSFGFGGLMAGDDHDHDN